MGNFYGFFKASLIKKKKSLPIDPFFFWHVTGNIAFFFGLTLAFINYLPSLVVCI